MVACTPAVAGGDLQWLDSASSLKGESPVFAVGYMTVLLQRSLERAQPSSNHRLVAYFT